MPVTAITKYTMPVASAKSMKKTDVYARGSRYTLKKRRSTLGACTAGRAGDCKAALTLASVSRYAAAPQARPAIVSGRRQ
jgi:hypothetical protein